MSKKELIEIQSYLDDLGADIAVETLELIKDATVNKGKSIQSLVKQKFLKSYVEALVLESFSKHINLKLNDSQDDSIEVGDLEKLADEVEDEFRQVKFEIQSSIATAFENAMLLAINQSIDYYVQIKPVGEPINKDPC